MLAAFAGCTSTDNGNTAPDARSDAPNDAGSESSVSLECPPTAGQCDAGAVCAEACDPGGICCLRVICAADASIQPILATNYDQSCTADSDCVAEGFGDPCTECLNCASGAINEKSVPQYGTDVAKAPRGAICFCAFGPAGPCCVDGICQVGRECSNAVPTDAAADRGVDGPAACVAAGGHCMVGGSTCA